MSMDDFDRQSERCLIYNYPSNAQKKASIKEFAFTAYFAGDGMSHD